MPALTDARFDALRVLVPAEPPTTNDMLFAWLATEGGSGDTLADRWFSMLLSKVAITTLNLTGVHDGLADSAFLEDSGETFPINGLVGRTIRNTTDGSLARIMENDGTTVTATLGSGTDNDWDIGDAYIIEFQGHRADMWKIVLAANGFTQPHLNDAELAFWVAGGALIA
jgi:hypothetical protein